MPSKPVQSYQPVAGVDPARIPFRTMSSGARMPSIGLGPFGPDHVSNDAVAEAVEYAATVGYRHFDCASAYDNEKQIGRALRAMFQEPHADLAQDGRAGRSWSGSSHWDVRNETERRKVRPLLKIL
jgi:diketogulonate reductase-like aldo/keto reductase